jgi:hypothetical protein
MSRVLCNLALGVMPQPAVMTVIAIVGIALMGVVWFALRYWLASTRPPNIKEVRTPKLDQLNREALEAMAGDGEDEDEEAPEELKKVVPEDQADKPA